MVLSARFAYVANACHQCERTRVDSRTLLAFSGFSTWQFLKLVVRLPRFSTTIRKRRHRFSVHCWRSKNEVASDLVLWEPKHGKRSVGGQARTFVDLQEVDIGLPRDSLPVAMDDRVGWSKRAMWSRLRST